MVPAASPRTIRVDGGWGGAAVCRTDELDAWRGFFETLARDHSSLSGCVVLKYGEDRCVIRADHPIRSGQVACRSVGEGRRPRLVELRSSAGRRDFGRLVGLQRAGVITPAPLGFIERASPGPESWLVTEFLDAAQDLGRIALTMLPRMAGNECIRRKRGLSGAVATWLAALVSCGWRHRDFKASNVLLRGIDSSSPEALVVDLEGLHRRRFWHRAPGRFEVIRLFASLLSSPTLTPRDAARFLRDLALQPGGVDLGPVREILAQAESYVSRARRRKTHKLDGFSGE